VLKTVTLADLFDQHLSAGLSQNVIVILPVSTGAPRNAEAQSELA